MELVIRKNDLLKELSLLQGIVERKNTIPILANVLIEASKDGISLLATDLDVGLRSHCEGTVGKTGVLTLPANCRPTYFVADADVHRSALPGGRR